MRFLGEFDNVLLGHADRRRSIPEDFPWQAMLAEGRFVSNVLVDGMLRATWRLDWERKRRVTLVIRPYRRLTAPEQAAVSEEAERFVDFVGEDAANREVRVEPAVG